MISVLSQLAKAILEILSIIWYYLIRIANNGHCETEPSEPCSLRVS